MAESFVMGYKSAAMRITAFLSLPVIALAIGCGETNLPNAQLYFTSGAETSSLKDVERYAVERINSKGKAEKLYSGSALPTTIDLGNSGTYRYRATGFDADDNAIARGETLAQDIGVLAGAQIPMFIARTDRTSMADSKLAVAPGEFPEVAIIRGMALWVWTNASTDYMTTDAYNFAYWQQVEPQGDSTNFSKVNCPQAPCELKTLLVVGRYLAVAIGTDWAIWVNEDAETAGELELPQGLNSFGEVAGGRVFPGASDSAVLVGATRFTEPTAQTLGFDAKGVYSALPLSTARAGAAALFEANVGLVVVGGSATGPGVERLAPKGEAYVPLNYPADPVVGAALVVEDETHVLRVGGQYPDETPAESVRIDVTCSAELCATEALPAESTLPILAARSFHDAESGDSLVIGQDATGVTVIYRYIAKTGTFSPVAIPDNQARIHATAVMLPNRQVALVGGSMPGGSGSRSILSVVSF